MILIAFANQIFPSDIGAIRIISPWPHISKHPIRERMLQEAALDGASQANLMHLASALIGYPNGRVRFNISEAMRQENTNEQTLRFLLGLNEDFEIRSTEKVTSTNPIVEDILKAAGEKPSTLDILKSVVQVLPPLNAPPNLSIYRYFVRAIQAGLILQVA
ncbi:MAG: hypothetical protein HYR97_08390 [Candidatus Melainabacteria bacterium]|nr:hypothetical protein [Candidatus Melainabacteria bacterium]MBI3309570.1 hypothetical protein [Candidatus Melainabacteria bacterium]